MKIDYSLIGRQLLHPLAVKILDVFAEDLGAAHSPVALSHKLGEPLGNVSYHVRVLAGLSKPSQYKPAPFADCPLLEVVDTRPVRGALEHFYGLTDHAIDAEATAGVEVDDREPVLA